MELNWGVLYLLSSTQMQDKNDHHKHLLQCTVHWGLFFSNKIFPLNHQYLFFIENFWWSYLNYIKKFPLHFISSSQRITCLQLFLSLLVATRNWVSNRCCWHNQMCSHNQKMQGRIRLCLPYFQSVYHPAQKQKLKQAELFLFSSSIYLYLSVCLHQTTAKS